MRPILAAILFWVCLGGSLRAATGKEATGPPLEQVRLQLKWRHQFQFAGYYAAVEKGYYRDAGLEVELLEGSPDKDPVDVVQRGEAEFGVGTADLLLLRSQGLPVVVLAAVFQHSATVLLTLKGEQTQTVHDLLNQRIMIEPLAADIMVYLQREGLGAGRYERIPHTGGIDALLRGEVAAMSAYLSDEPFSVRATGADVAVLDPRSGGIDFYGDCLFTTDSELNKHRDRVQRFRAASMRGWSYAMEHPEEMVDLILAKYSERHTREHLLYEARAMVPLIRADLVEIGHMHQGRWQHIADIYRQTGMLANEIDWEAFIYTPESPNEENQRWLVLSGVLALMMLISGGVALKISRLNRQLRKSMVDLRESQVQFRTLAETSDAGIFVLKGLRFQIVNPAMERISGYSAGELLAMRNLELIHPESRGLVEERALARQRGDDIPEHYEVRLLRKNGEDCWVRVGAGRITVNGEPCSVGIFFDITPKRAAESRLRESEATHRLLAENVSDVIWVLNLNRGAFSYISPSVERLRGYTPEEAMAQSLEQSLEPESAETVRDAIAKNLQEFIRNPNEGVSYIHELRQPCKDGRVIWIETSTQYRYNAAGEIEILGVSRNIEARKHLEELREDVERIARHDLKTPLVGMIGLPQILEFDSNLTEEQREMLQQISSLGKTMLKMIDFSLNLYKQEIGAYRYQPVRVDVLAVIGEVLLSLSPRMDSTKVNVSLEVNGKPAGPTDAVVIPGEDILLFSLFTNLLLNALEASTDEATIEIKITTQDTCTIAIHNQGVVPEAMRTRFFAKYATAGKSGGTGLGTYSAWMITRTLSGTIAMLSPDRDGTTVTVCLPLHFPGEPPAESTPAGTGSEFP